jgi:hypothetical protein
MVGGVGMVVKNLFHDKRLTVIVLLAWMSLACTIFYNLGAFHGQFMTFGPSDSTEFMSMKIDTWSVPPLATPGRVAWNDRRRIAPAGSSGTLSRRLASATRPSTSSSGPPSCRGSPTRYR